MFHSNRYRRLPDSGSDSNIGPGPGPGIGPNRNPPFIPFDNVSCITYSQMNIVNEMRYLWLQLVIWTRAYINNSGWRQGAVSATYERLYSVPTAFYNYINLFFGQAIAEQFVNLLSQYIIIFSELINAMIVGNQQAANSSQSLLIADYMSKGVMSSLMGNGNNQTGPSTGPSNGPENQTRQTHEKNLVRT